MALNQSRVKFIEQHKNDVISATIGTGIFPSVKMAQMIIESSDKGIAGGGITARKANNYFGIKANKSWTGEKMSFSTPKDALLSDDAKDKVSYFRVYPTAKDSIIDHTNFLKVNPRYEKAGVFSAKNVPEQLQALQKSGYSQSPDYASMLAKIIRDYNLESLDSEQSVKKKRKFLIIAIIIIVSIIILLLLFKYKKVIK